MGGARWEGGGSLFSTGPGSHYFHVADWGMERGGIMSRRYSRWRSTAEEVLCTAKLGLTNARAPPVLRGAFFQLEVALPLPALTALSECLPVLLTRAVAEAAFCSLGDWLNVCRMPRGVVAEPRDSWLEAYSGKRGQQLMWGRGQQKSRCSPQPLLDLAHLFPPTRDP